MDPLDVGFFLEENMDLLKTEAYTPLFENYGVENMNFLFNSGSFFVILGMMILYFALKTAVSCLA